MTQETTEKPKAPTKSQDLAARIKVAAARKFLANPTDAELAKEMDVSVYTIADWKRRQEWESTVRELADSQLAHTHNELCAMAPLARQVLLDMMREGPATTKFKAAQFVCEMAMKTSF